MGTKYSYHDIVTECEDDLREHGDTYLGMGWTKKNEYAELRYKIMTDVLPSAARGDRISLLDVGCGTARLYEHILRRKIPGIQYSGVDLSTSYLSFAEKKFPKVSFYNEDILSESHSVPIHDYVVMNGVLTYKGRYSSDEMWNYAKELLAAAWQISRQGLAFNVMTKYLDWERDDLFHLPLDKMAAFVAQEMSRSFTVRHDYGLFEYTVYVYRADLSQSL